MQLHIFRANLLTYDHAEAEHQKIDSLVVQNLSGCCGTSTVEWRIVDQCNVPKKLITLEAIHIEQRKPLLNTDDECGNQELTLKY